MAVNYAELLCKYIEHVGQCEGITFITQIGDRSDVIFSEEEISELCSLSDYPFTENSYNNNLKLAANGLFKEGKMIGYWPIECINAGMGMIHGPDETVIPLYSIEGEK